MANTPEGKVKAKVKALLDKYKIYHFMPATGGYGRSGIPDIICCANGKFLAIECKAHGGRLTALQRRELDRIELAGGVCYVIYGEDVGPLEEILTSYYLKEGVRV